MVRALQEISLRPYRRKVGNAEVEEGALVVFSGRKLAEYSTDGEDEHRSTEWAIYETHGGTVVVWQECHSCREGDVVCGRVGKFEHLAWVPEYDPYWCRPETEGDAVGIPGTLRAEARRLLHL